LIVNFCGRNEQIVVVLFSGGYVYFDVFSQQNRQEVIRLVGPNMTSGGIGRPRLCLTFWFAAFGAGDTTQLRVLMMDSVTSSEKGRASMLSMKDIIFIISIMLKEFFDEIFVFLEIWMVRVVQLEAIRPDWNFGSVQSI
jgi:hypothetical protein